MLSRCLERDIAVGMSKTVSKTQKDSEKDIAVRMSKTKFHN